MTMNTKTWVVVLLTDVKGPMYLGELDRGCRQGVRQLKNAVRFTSVGAKRVAAGYGTIDSREGATVISEAEAR
jgi:hypothetical protein